MWKLGLWPHNSTFGEYLFRIFGIGSLQCELVPVCTTLHYNKRVYINLASPYKCRKYKEDVSWLLFNTLWQDVRMSVACLNTSQCVLNIAEVSVSSKKKSSKYILWKNARLSSKEENPRNLLYTAWSGEQILWVNHAV